MCGQRRGPGTGERPAGGRTATAAALCVPRRGLSHRAPRPGAEETVNVTAGAATGAAASALPSPPASAASSDTAAAAAQAPPPPPANLVSGSRRGAAIGRRKAPRHNGAGRRRRAGRRWGFPLSPRPRQPSECGRRAAACAPRVAQGGHRGGAGVGGCVRAGRSRSGGGAPALGGGAGGPWGVEVEDGAKGRSRWGWPHRCGYLSALTCQLGLRAAGRAGAWRRVLVRSLPGVWALLHLGCGSWAVRERGSGCAGWGLPGLMRPLPGEYALGRSPVPPAPTLLTFCSHWKLIVPLQCDGGGGMRRLAAEGGSLRERLSVPPPPRGAVGQVLRGQGRRPAVSSLLCALS